MTRVYEIRHQFVESFPSPMDAGVLYISIEYKSMGHLCFCGCGKKVVTPLSPTGWKMTFDGRSISVAPSIGSWQLACRSHYWIHSGTVKWASTFTEGMIEKVYRRDIADKERYYKSKAALGQTTTEQLDPPIQKPRGVLGTLKGWVLRSMK